MSNNYNWSQQYYPTGYTKEQAKKQLIKKEINDYVQNYHQYRQQNNYQECGYEEYGRRQNNYNRNKKKNHYQDDIYQEGEQQEYGRDANFNKKKDNAYHDDERNTQKHSRNYDNKYQQNYQNNPKPSNSNNKNFSNEDSSEYIPFFGPGQHVSHKKEFNLQSWQGKQIYKNTKKYKNHIEDENDMSYSSFSGQDPPEISKSKKEDEDKQKYLGVESFYTVDNNQTIGYGQVGRLGGSENPTKKKKKKKNGQTTTPPPKPMPKNKSNIEQYSKELDVEQKEQISDSKVCPFNENHRMPEKRLLTHIEKCKHSTYARGYANCPFDPLHWERSDQIEAHKLICPQRVMSISSPDWDKMVFESHKQEQVKIIDNELENEVKKQTGNNIIEDLCEEEYERKVDPKKKEYEDWVLDGDF